MNAVVFQVSARGDAFFESSQLPWSYILSGQPDQDPGWDPLQTAIDEAHKRGLELHAWFNVFSVAYNSFADSPATADTPNIRFTRPEWMVSTTDDAGNEHIWLNPAIPEAREWQVQNVVDLVENYNIDAVHFDRIRYFGDGYEGDQELFEEYNPEGLDNIDDWRRYNVTEFVREAHEQIREIKPWVKIGAAVSGHYNHNSSDGWPARFGYSEVFADSRYWAVQGYVDYLSPMNYWNISNPPRFDFISEDWADHAADQYHIYMGTGAYKQDVYNELHHQIDVTRELEIEGQLHYRYSNIEDVQDHYSGRYSFPAIIPQMPGHSDETPPAAENLSITLIQDSLALSWEHNMADTVTSERYTYAIYSSTPMVQSGNETKLIALTGEHEISLPAALWQEGEEIVLSVTSLSRNYAESEPISADAIATSGERIAEVPGSVHLHQNYPNPFNPETTIRFDLPQQEFVNLSVYDIAGRRVAELVDGIHPSGTHQINFNASRLASGIYIYRLQAGSHVQTRRMVLIK